MGSHQTDLPPARVGAEEGEAPASRPSLPAWKAFVVQFTIDSDPATGVFAGRVEHLSSGTRLRFSSNRELLDCLQRLLDDARE